ncbi:hypothetical protein ACHAQA_010142 [Verticillium albo-atrum]
MAFNAPAPHALPTVISLKQTFLESQTRLLAQDLTPSRRWRDDNAAAAEPLPAAALDDALYSLNQTLQQHARRVHPPQSTRLIAEQIDKLYQADGAAIAQEDRGGLATNADLTDDETIASLPPTWPAVQDTNTLPMEAKRYADQVSALSALAARRSEMRERVERLRRFETAIHPFRAGEDGLGLQENLVTRGGDVERELERMRMLLVRVSGRIASLPESSSSSISIRPPSETERAKVEDLLDRF